MVHQESGYWPIHRHVLREHGVVLAGPPIQTLIDPVQPDELREAVRGIAPEYLRDFNVEQIRRMQRLCGVEKAPFHRLRVRGAQENFEHRRSVNDDHSGHVPRGPLLPVPPSE